MSYWSSDVCSSDLLGGQVDVAIGLAALVFGHAVPVEVVDVLDALHVHDEALEPVGELGGDRIAVDAADLLEVGELADLHAVAPDLPAEAPGAHRRALPVVLAEADVVRPRVDAEGAQRTAVELMAVRRRGLPRSEERR